MHINIHFDTPSLVIWGVHVNPRKNRIFAAAKK